MKWKILAASLAVLLVASNAWHVYRAVDHGVTDMYHDEVTYELANRVIATAMLADMFVKDQTQAEAVALLKRAFPDDEPFVKEGAVHTTWVSLKLTQGNRVGGIDVGAAKIALDSHAHQAE